LYWFNLHLILIPNPNEKGKPTARYTEGALKDRPKEDVKLINAILLKWVDVVELAFELISAEIDL
jgi:hypothetical protein